MFYLIQIIKMLDKEQQKLFISIFDDLSYEIEEMGYNHIDDQCELISDLIFNHFNIELDDIKQIKVLTESIIKHQGRLEQHVTLLSAMV